MHINLGIQSTLVNIYTYCSLHINYELAINENIKALRLILVVNLDNSIILKLFRYKVLTYFIMELL